MHFGCVSRFLGLCLDEILFQDMAHINDLLLGDTKVALGILCSCVTHQPSYLTQTQTIPLLFFLFFLVGFNKRVM
jgi:hypothetical protein